MTYEEAIDFIHAANWKGSVLGLERITSLMEALGNPQKQLKFVHVAGTNGKGSTCAMISSILVASGIKTGLYTSPHLQKYNERIKINGVDISDDDLCEVAETVKAAVDKMEDVPTEFERFTAMALLYFAKVKCELVVFEVGLGGRMDSTNVIDAPEVAVICNLGLEHTDVLGDTIDKIAFEKAGIIKPGCNVVLYHQEELLAEQTVLDKAAECQCPVIITDPEQEKLISCDLFGQNIDYRSRKNIPLNLLGTYQYSNAAVVLDTIDALISRGYKIPDSAIEFGLSSVFWPGRFQVLCREPLVILDGAHNPNGVEELVHCIKTFLPGKSVNFVMGVMADKDYVDEIRLIAPLANKFIAVGPEYYRALSSDKLAAAIKKEVSIPVFDAGSVADGVKLGFMESSHEHPTVIFGSLYQIDEVMKYLSK